MPRYLNTDVRTGEAYEVEADSRSKRAGAWLQGMESERRPRGCVTTFTSYGTVTRDRQAGIMRGLAGPQRSIAPTEDLLRQLAEAVSKEIDPKLSKDPKAPL